MSKFQIGDEVTDDIEIGKVIEIDNRSNGLPDYLVEYDSGLQLEEENMIDREKVMNWDEIKEYE